MANAQAFEITEFRKFERRHFVVPFTVLSELDLLMQRNETRDRARAALHVLKSFTDRGAAQNAVSCGENTTFRIAKRSETVSLPDLDLDLADDRILATGLSLIEQDTEVLLATTDFALHAKALSAGIGSEYLERYAATRPRVGRREQIRFRHAWSQVEAARSEWSLCRRAITFLRIPFVSVLVKSLCDQTEPDWPAQCAKQFVALSLAWQGDAMLYELLTPVFGIDPPTPVDYSVRELYEPPVFPKMLGGSRLESEQERVIRIKAAERAFEERQDFIMDAIIGRLEAIREYILDHVGDELL